MTLPIGSVNLTDRFKMSNFIFGDCSDSAGVDNPEVPVVDKSDGETDDAAVKFMPRAVSECVTLDLGISIA